MHRLLLNSARTRRLVAGWARALWVSIACAAALAQAEPVPAVRPVGPALEVRPPFDFDKKTRRSVSGIACAPDAAGVRCLLVFDEGRHGQFARLEPQRLLPRRLVPFGPPIELSGSGGELDAEGAAWADGFFYVTGSHSVKRKSCQPNPASRVLVRFRLRPSGGAPARVEVADRVLTERLWTSMRDQPGLKPHLDGCLGEGSGGSAVQRHARPGLNIEGLALAGGRLYAGFRGPSQGGSTPVFSVDAKALFEGGDARPRLDQLPLGAHVGIRDMAAARESMLLLLGPDDEAAGTGVLWQLAEWRPGASTVRTLATLDLRRADIGTACFDALKPEALAILDESPRRFRVLLLSDGVCDGGPLIVDIPR